MAPFPALTTTAIPQAGFRVDHPPLPYTLPGGQSIEVTVEVTPAETAGPTAELRVTGHMRGVMGSSFVPVRFSRGPAGPCD